ncbi:MAG: hypothetical protein R6V84_06715 [Desulfobacterales bacterium]
MRAQFLKIAAFAAVLLFISTGVSLAKDWNERGRYTPRGQVYGHYKQPGPPSHAYGPRHTYQQPRHHYHQSYHSYQHRYPVVVQKHYYSPPAYYAPTAPSGVFFGMSIFEPGFGFSFGVSGR